MNDRITHRFADGSSITGPSQVVTSAVHHERSEAAKQSEWAAYLLREGVKAAHPDDGWVNREANAVTFAYPYFDHSPDEGDLIALGSPDKYRMVRVVSVRRWGVLTPMTTYSFREEGS